MPKARPHNIVTFSSEDPNHPASNLLSAETYRKWKCKEAGEAEAFVVIQLEKAEKILSVDIGNECSAFVEIFVGRSGGGMQNFEVLQSSTVLMSPSESKSISFPNRTRMFSSSLNKLVGSQKWDLVKVVCTQPFNRQIQYGLSFINIITHSDDDKPKIGGFEFRADPVAGDEYGDPIRIGSLFAKRMGSTSLAKKQADALHPLQVERIVLPSTAATIRADSANPGTRLPSNCTQKKRKAYSPSCEQSKSFSSSNMRTSSVCLNDPSCSKQPVKSDEHLESQSKVTKTRDQEFSRQNLESDDDTPTDLGKKKVRLTEKSPSIPTADDAGRSSHSTFSNTATSSQTHITSENNNKPFSTLFSGVVFAISGYQNPSRSEIRRKAIEMGARYKQDWDSSCTHLICAFVNTPKFREVKAIGNGKIVNNKWINDSYRSKRRFPWRRYCLDRTDAGPESEEEILASEPHSRSDEESLTSSNPADRNISPRNTDQKRKHSDHTRNTELLNGRRRAFVVSSSSSEEEEPEPEVNPSAAYEIDTDVDDDGVSISNSNTTKNAENTSRGFFNSLVFFLHPSEPSMPDKRKRIEELIVRNNGLLLRIQVSLTHLIQKSSLESTLLENINYVVTENKDWHPDFSEALSDNPNLVIVREDWILDCELENQVISSNPYMILE